MSEFLLIQNRLECVDEKIKFDSIVRSCAHEFEDALLGKSAIEKDAFIFIINLLSNDKIMKCPSASFFLSILNTEFYLFSTDQVKDLIETIKLSKYFQSSPEIVIAAGADLLARQLPRKQAEELFHDAGLKGNKFFNEFGTDVLRKRVARME